MNKVLLVIALFVFNAIFNE